MVNLYSIGWWSWKACTDTIHGSCIETAICNFHWWGISLIYIGQTPTPAINLATSHENHNSLRTFFINYMNRTLVLNGFLFNIKMGRLRISFDKLLGCFHLLIKIGRWLHHQKKKGRWLKYLLRLVKHVCYPSVFFEGQQDYFCQICLSRFLLVSTWPT